MTARSIDTILTEADSAAHLNELIDLWDEIVIHKYQYSLVQIKTATEHISGLVPKTVGEESIKERFISFLENTKSSIK